jgi:hypothetical protein
MQIGGSYNYNRSQLVALESNPATTDQAGQRQRLRQANDCYSKNAASAPVIDAEYVDLYTPDSLAPQQPQRAEVIFETPESPVEKPAIQVLEQPATEKYLLQTPDTPPPGTYVNYFA